MSKIDLNQILEAHPSLGKKEIGLQLFPTNKHPVLALSRILSGAAQLNAEQVSKLALMLGVDIATLYKGGDWHTEGIEGKIIFKRKTFTAILDTETLETQLYDGASMFHDIILSPEGVQLSEYLDNLNSIINKHVNT